jgi:xanthine/uracil/vitamin C permease (AzgA family)
MPFEVPLPAVVDNYFKVTERGSTLFTELRAAGATFLTMCYILAGVSQSPARAGMASGLRSALWFSCRAHVRCALPAPRRARLRR